MGKKKWVEESLNKWQKWTVTWFKMLIKEFSVEFTLDSFFSTCPINKIKKIWKYPVLVSVWVTRDYCATGRRAPYSFWESRGVCVSRSFIDVQSFCLSISKSKQLLRNNVIKKIEFTIVLFIMKNWKLSKCPIIIKKISI